jgi:hypothetical protein
LVNLIVKKKPVKKRAKVHSESTSNTLFKPMDQNTYVLREIISDKGNEDETLMQLFKK